MPKKSNRSSHGSAMSQLFPDVSLDEEETGASPDDASDDVSEEPPASESAELQKNSSTDNDGDQENSSSTVLQNYNPSLDPVPASRPDLTKKLGPYVSPDVGEALEEVYLLLRRRFGPDASKSLIVEASLRLVLADCLDRGDDSPLVRWMDDVLDD